MFGLSAATKVYLAVEPVDMRKSFEGLYGLARDWLEADPKSGHLFVFANRDRTRVKVLLWDGSGLWVCAKRLEKGRFDWPRELGERRSVVVRPEQLAMLLNGLEVGRAQARRGWGHWMSAA